ncbi:SURF1 family protein [Actinopolymorpha alba]|uniref:SURF1 family cytochrome oxidase biogenesis protein n=1 Tax=Actinopolymorpha alba TaxID=533267 RepID=UPI00039C8240|nr:SURF1 family protein [Actinopolymorpha alba]
MYRFLLRPRWIALMVAVVVLVTTFVLLARWQLQRLDERRALNAVITTNDGAPSRPVGTILAPDRPARSQDQWRQLSARGTYDAEHQILVRYRPLEGEPGYNVLTPLVTTDGNTILVNRGWIPSSGSVRAPASPAPPSGDVTITGRVRQSEHADPGRGRPERGQVRFIDVPQIAGTLPYPVLGGYLELVEPVPTAAGAPRPLPAPELSEGPHLAYALQWYLFAAVAVGGLGFLAYDEAKGGRLRQRLRSADEAAGSRPRRSPAGSPGRRDTRARPR